MKKRYCREQIIPHILTQSWNLSLEEENIVIGSTLENQNHHNIGFEHFNLERKAQTKAF